MDEQQIFKQVKTVVSKYLSVNSSEITKDASFIDDLGADSLDLVELVMEFEDHFEIEISDIDAEKMRTVSDIVDYIKAK